jgi:hypothetical protein
MKGLVQYILLAAVLTVTLSITAFADVKVKSRTTMSGQTTENTTYIKGKRSRTEQNMGGSQMVTLTQCDMKRSIQLNPQTQVYIINSWENDTTAPTTTTVSGNTKTEVKKGGVITTTITTKDTGETRKMFGYVARHLIVTIETEASADACTPMKKSKMVTDGWYIDAAFALDCDYGTSGGYYRNTNSGGCRDKYDVKQIGTAKRGYPVIEKMTMFDETGKETFTMMNEVLELATATLDAALFDVPKDWREVKDSSAMYASMSSTSSTSYSSSSSTTQNSSMNNPSTNNSSMNSTISSINSQKSEANSSATLEAKKPGVVRVGLAGVKTGAIGEGVNAAELAGAIQNTLAQYLKGTKVELVPLEAKLASAIESEAKEKDCDFVLYATVSHKKGGGGFGFGKALGAVVAQTGGGSWGNTAGNVAGQVAATSVVAATSNIKAKDELTLDIKLQNGAAQALVKQFKSKAKAAGEDIISPIVEQAATAIVETIGK